MKLLVLAKMKLIVGLFKGQQRVFGSLVAFKVETPPLTSQLKRLFVLKVALFPPVITFL